MKTFSIIFTDFFFCLERVLQIELLLIQVLNSERLYSIIICLDNKGVGSQDPFD
jgi:hypothetical protein